jgi:6-pyruvoyltetrahydropterin 2'-reductase
MAKYEWSEVFMSIEGEAKYSGHPTAYIRFTKCNFECRGFNNPNKEDTTSIEVLGFNPADYQDIYSIPLITKGCDSIYSWDEKFSHMWHKGTENDLGAELLSILPGNQWKMPTGRNVILSLTGGEPTLRAKFIPTLLEADAFKDCKHVLIETNCAVPLQWNFIGDMNEWLCGDTTRKLTWSNSPKLSVSGEKWEDAIVPKIAAMQRMVTGREGCNQVDQYFKFVCGPTEEDFAEVERAMQMYYAGELPATTDVYIMPTACTEEQQQSISAQVAKMCIDRGYIYCHRIQNSVFGNGVGT